MLPKLIDTGTFFLPTYGVLVATAFLVAIWVTTRLARRDGLDAQKVTDLALYCAAGGMLGAKLFMFLFDWRKYLSGEYRLFSIDTLMAAGVFQGGLIVAVLVAIWFMRSNGLPGLRTSDVFAPGLAIGHGIGRLGCFAAGCCWGDKCDLPWAVTFRNPQATELTGVPLGVPLHPTQLYESFAELAIFGVLWLLIHKPHREGSVLGTYMVLYSTVRFLVEFVRNHEQSLIMGLSLTQWISLGTLMAGLWLILRPGAVKVPSPPATAV
ncbi:MAG: prolipoprotein diacylglyceryl transferase [Bryobacteraceae bacterium]|nr:prolipoprotein diacylglyceryl transferase [Bryobacteraceae bacterium]